MKRTKTFVMKFLSVFILGAAVLATSCTKDLEDRMDKVEETLATVVKNTADLEAALKALPNISGVTLSTAMVDGKQVLTFKVPGQTDTKITIDIPAYTDNNDAANVTVTSDAATNTTTVGIKQPDGTIKSFTYPTSIPTNVSGIVVASEINNLFEVKGVQTVTITLNTNDNKPVALSPSNVIITNAYKTKASIYTETENLKVVSVSLIPGTSNQFDILIEGQKVAANADYRLGIKQSANNVMATESFNAEVKAFNVIDEVLYSPIGSQVFGILGGSGANAILGTTLVDNKTTDFKATFSLAYTNDLFTDNNVTYNVADTKVECFEIIGATNAAAALTTANFGTTQLLGKVATDNAITTFDAAVKTLRDAAATVAVPYPGVKPNAVANGAIAVDFTIPALDAAKVGKRYFVVAISNKCTGDDKVNRNFGVIEVDMRDNQHFTPAAVKVANILTMTYDVTDALSGSYYVATGLNAIAGTFDIKVLKDKTDVTGTSAVATPKLTGDSRLGYTVNLDKSLVAGEYTVIVTNVDYKTNKNLVITQTVTIAYPEFKFAAQATASLGKGYAADGVYNSIAVSPIVFDYTFASYIKATVPAAADYPVADYEVYYRLYDATAKAYLDGLTTNLSSYTYSGTAATKVTAAETEVIDATAANQRIAYDKAYQVHAYIVFKGGQTIAQETGLSIKYAVPAKISGFLAKDEKTFTPAYALGTTMDALTTLSLEYTKDAKTFFFANGTGDNSNWYLNSTDTKLVDKSILAIKDIAYEILPVNYDVTFVTITGATVATPAEQYTYLQFSNSSLTANYAAIKTAGFNTVYAFAAVSPAAGTACTAVLKPFVQPIKVTIFDVWDRKSELTINVTVGPKL